MTEFKVNLTSTSQNLTLGLCENFSNASEVRELAMSGKLDCVIIKASLIAHPLQVAVAANKERHSTSL